MPYDEAPSRRMAWDADGTVAAWQIDNGASVDLTGIQMAELNDEDGTNIIITSRDDFGYISHIFPELREFDGYFIARRTDGAGGFGSLETSVDTTNGMDGTWIQQAADIADPVSVIPEFRDEITSFNIPVIKAVRVYKDRVGQLADDEMLAIHIYGIISPGETPDRIIFLDTERADAEFTKVLDFGDKPRGGTTTRTFKIKNNSSTKTINTIQVTAEDLFLNAGDWYTFGDDGVNYQATFAIGNLGPGATKLLYLKQIVPDAETLGLQTGRIKVSHADVT